MTGSPTVANLNELISAIAENRDECAFTELFTGFGPLIKSYLKRSGCSDAQAEELVQEAMWAVWLKADQFDTERGAASAWMFGIARNLRVDSFRRTPCLLNIVLDGPTEEPGPHEHLSGIQTAALLEAALADLPADQATVIHAAYVEFRSHAEIAEHFGLPLGTVKSRLRLALQRLRAQLEPLS